MSEVSEPSKFPSAISSSVANQQVIAVEPTVSHGVHICGFQAVQGADAQIPDPVWSSAGLAHGVHPHRTLWYRWYRLHVDGDLLVGEEHEVLDKDLAASSEPLWVNRPVGSNLQVQLRSRSSARHGSCRWGYFTFLIGVKIESIEGCRTRTRRGILLPKRNRAPYRS